MKINELTTSFNADTRTEFRNGGASVEQVHQVTQSFIVEHPNGKGIVGFVSWTQGHPVLHNYSEEPTITLDMTDPTGTYEAVKALPSARLRGDSIRQEVTGKEKRLRVQTTLETCAVVGMQPSMPILMDEEHDFGGKRLLMVSRSITNLHEFIVFDPFAQAEDNDALSASGWVKPVFSTFSEDELTDKILSHATYVTGIREA